MSVAEIEKAVWELPEQEQKSLLKHLFEAWEDKMDLLDLEESLKEGEGIPLETLEAELDAKFGNSPTSS